MKITRIFKIVGGYRYFIVGVLAVSLLYGLFFVFRRSGIERGPELPQVQRINYERFVLANGLEVIIHPDYSAPTVSVNMSYRVGSRDEPRGKTGLAHLSEHLMLEAGALRSSKSESLADRLGALEYNGSTDRDRTRLYMTVPKQALDAALWSESERMGYLADKLSEEAIPSARQDVFNELRRNQSAADAAFEAALTEAMFPLGHPYSHLPGGLPEDLETISLQDVKQWLKDYYKPNNATLVVAGEVDPAAVRGRIETYFGSIPGGPRSRELVSRIPRQESFRRYTTPAIPDKTLAFVWALPGQGSPDLDSLDLARHLLEARLTQRLVTEDRVANAVRVDLKPYQLCSLLVLKMELNEQGTEANVLSSFKQELRDLTANEAQSVELDEARRGILLSLLFTSERVGGPVGKAEILASAATLAGSGADFNSTVERVRQASPNAVRVVVGAWLSIDAATLLTHGPKAEIQTAPVASSNRPLTMPSASAGEGDTQVQIVPERMRLANGLTILMVKRPGPVGAAKLVWPKESSLSVSDEQLMKATLNLLSEGTGSQRQSALQRDPARLSLQWVLDDTPNYYAIGLELPGQYLSSGLEVFSGLVVGASFDESRVAAIRARWEQRLKRTEPSSWKVYLSTLLRLISTNRLDDARRLDCGPLASFSASDIQKTYDTQFRPDQATLIIAGDIDPASMKAEATKFFSAWRGAGNQTATSLTWPSESTVGIPLYIIDRPGPDSAITLTGLASQDLRSGGSANDIITTVLDSRANRILRDEHQIAHEIFAGHFEWEKNGIMYVYAHGSSERFAEALRLVDQAFRFPENRDTFCEVEFRRARKISARRSVQALESTRSLMSFLTASAIGAGQEPLAVPTSCEDILDVSRRMSDGAKIIRLVLGDSKRLELESRSLGQRVEIIQRPCWSSLY